MYIKSILRMIYRALPFKHQIIATIRALGLGAILSDRLKSYLVFEGAFTVQVEGRSFLIGHGYGREIESKIFWGGLSAFEGNTLHWWITLAKRSKVILDVGANTGIYSLVAKTLNPLAEVHAFEPIGRVYSILISNIALNQAELTPPQIAAHRIALSDYNGEGQMFDLPVEHMYTASLNKDIHSERGNPTRACTEPVKVKRLDHFLNSHNCEGLDLIKIDVESHEPFVLSGLGDWLPRFHPSLIVEVWDNDVGAKVEAALHGCEYRFFALSESTTEPRSSIRNDFPEKGYLNYLIVSEKVAREFGLLDL